ncbi:hypothetical protein [Halocalculus aciditolerans]|uniref:Uncharacterized protein n=1 Tax=Halocalculus aciditolerans TaxID=1383812 RepID=A0A830FHL0_9EURY|nr:hypothetical protein [Halocalculus aciditolerans]GGL53525.1 hypothetical protein GCM10009039_09660 [Halocalculus aciditolerans]
MQRARLHLATTLRVLAAVTGLFAAEEASMHATLGDGGFFTRLTAGLSGRAERVEPDVNSLPGHGGPTPLYKKAGRAAITGLVVAGVYAVDAAKYAGAAVAAGAVALAGFVRRHLGDEPRGDELEAPMA